MITIWKYRLPEETAGEIDTPEIWDPLTLQLQDGYPHIWALVDTDTPIVARKVLTIGTGEPIPIPLDGLALGYLGTFQFVGGVLVYHVFTVE